MGDMGEIAGRNQVGTRSEPGGNQVGTRSELVLVFRWSVRREHPPKGRPFLSWDLSIM